MLPPPGVRTANLGVACLACSFRGPLIPKQEQVILGLVLCWTITPGLGVTGLDRTFQPSGVLNMVRMTTWPLTYLLPQQMRQRITFQRRIKHHLLPRRYLLERQTTPEGSTTVFPARFRRAAIIKFSLPWSALRAQPSNRAPQLLV